MNLPKWDDRSLKAGTMVRGALWLIAEVGEGGIFTKEDVRQAFPRIAQADRRIRDLRDYGWVIHTNTDDASLRPGEQRLVMVGVPVWDSKERQANVARTISAKQRQATLAADSYQCVTCGIAGGEAYPDNPTVTAVLSVTLRSFTNSDRTTDEQLVTQCKLCRAGAEKVEHADVGKLLSDVRDLDPGDRERMRRWIQRGRRGPTPLDRVWNAYRRLPEATRARVIEDLGGS